MKTKQQIFDKVLNHLRAQGKPALEDDGPSCKYFDSATGASCAVGCLIPREEYDPTIEGIAILDTISWLDAESREYLPKRYQKLLDILDTQEIDTTKDGLEFLRKLQHAHDSQSSFKSLWMNSFEFEMNNIAEEYNLEYKEN